MKTKRDMNLEAAKWMSSRASELRKMCSATEFVKGSEYSELLARQIRRTLGDLNDETEPVVVLIQKLRIEIESLRAQVAGRVEVPEGWAIRRNSDGSIGVFAPPPTDGESKRTSHAIYPGARSDLAELMFKFFTHLLAAAPEPVQTKENSDVV